MPIHVEIVSQERKLFEEKEADMVIVPGAEGILGILSNHTPLVSLLGLGELIVRKGGAEEAFAIYGGFVEIRPDKVVVLADAADFAGELSLREAEEARMRVLKLLEEGVPPEDQTFMAQELKRAELALSLARKHDGRGGRVGVRIVQQERQDN